MDILGIGLPELILVFIIALMVFGPRRLPEIAAKAGKFVRDLRNMSQGFMAEWQREITVAARLEELQEVKRELEETKKSLRQTQADFIAGAPSKKDLDDVQKELEETKKALRQAQKDVATESATLTETRINSTASPLKSTPSPMSPNEVLND